MVRELDQENGRVIWAKNGGQEKGTSPFLAAYVTVGGDYDGISLSVQNGPTVELGLDKDGGFLVTVFRHKCRVIIESDTLDDEDELIECIPVSIGSYFPWGEFDLGEIHRKWAAHCKRNSAGKWLTKEGFYRLPNCEELVEMGRDEFLSVKGFGPLKANKVGEILSSMGYGSWSHVD